MFIALRHCGRYLRSDLPAPTWPARGDLGILLVVACCCLLGPSVGTAQVPKKNAKSVEELTLNTKDGVYLRCTYYKGSNGKKTVPVILLHDWGGSRGHLHALALELQKLKHAVVVPDLRGHGRSTRRRNPIPGGEEIQLDREVWGKREISSMLIDLETVKRHLLKENNAGKVNIEQLCVLGCGLGATLAVNWAVLDWNVQSLPAYKQGQDVKALILVSPKQSFKGITPKSAFTHVVVRKHLSILIAVGSGDSRAYSDAKRLYNSFERFHTDPDKRDLVFLTPDTNLQGARLLAQPNLRAARNVGVFINERLVKKADQFRWRDRPNPLGDK